MDNYQVFIKKLGDVFQAIFSTLKPGAICGVVVMDIRKKSVFYPFHSDLSTEMKKRGYLLRDIIIWDRQKEYNNLKPLGYPYSFIVNKVHEYILVFQKPNGYNK